MKLFKKGSSGREVGDIQNRLVSAGFLSEPGEEVEESSFGPRTEAAVRAFQQERGLMADGIVGPDSWRSLVEASRTLGSRFLYLRVPPFRGDDVAELQRRLDGLGFFAGKEDGIFGNSTELAVEQFQRNCGLPPDGIVGTKTVEALQRLSRVTKPTSVAAIRESEKGLPTTGIAGRRVMIDPGHGYPPDPGESGPSGLKESEVAERVAEMLGQKLVELRAVAIHSRRPGEYLTDAERVARANRQEVDLVLSIHLNASTDPNARGSSCYYFASGNYRSPYGYRLSHHLQDELVARLGVPDCRSHGRAYRLLRDTRMPTIVVEPVFITHREEESLLSDGEFLDRIAVSIAEATRKYFAGVKSRAEDP